MANHNKRNEEEVFALKNKLYSKKEFLEKFNRHKITVNNWYREFNIKEKRTIKYKFTINKDFFKKWSKEMAWVLGFICADGSVYLTPRNGGTLSIGLAEKDLKILEQINFLMQSNYPIRRILTNKKTISYRLDITVRSIVDDLINLGVMPNKSKKLKWIQVPENYVWHFIRGYYDGDGSIFYGKGYLNSEGKQTTQLRTSVLGTEDFLIGIKNNFTNYYPEYNPKIQDRSNNGYYRLEISGTLSAIKLCELLYKDSSDLTRLDRKYKKYITYIDSFIK